MTPRLGTPCAIAVASMLLASPFAYARESRSEPRLADPSAIPDTSASLAGRRAGEGRARPGRSLGPEILRPGDTPDVATEDPDSNGDVRPSSSASASGSTAVESPGPAPSPSDEAGAARERKQQAVPKSSAEPVPVLTLGVGIVLVGLGLGFLGVRLRRQ